MVEQYQRHPNIECIVCKTPIYKRPIEIQKNNGRVFCSQACYGISCRKESPCPICGKLILAGLNKKTCSKGCANRQRTGIKYKLNRPMSKVASERALKIRLLGLRGKSCEKCGYGEFRILQVHHKDRNKGNNDMDNLELICPNCHSKEHYLEKSWLKNY